MAETTFGIAYDGPALTTGRMPVRDLAPALLALGDLFSLASGVLHPHLEPVAVKVEATKEGSFFVHLLIDAEDAWDHVVDLFGSQGASALTNLRDLILTSGGLFWLVKRLKGHKVRRDESQPEPGVIRLKLDGTTTLDVPSEVWSLFTNSDIRKHMRDVVEPLARQGIEEVRFVTERPEEALVVEKSDLPAYASTDGADQEEVYQGLQEMYVEVIAPAFVRGNKWRVNIGVTTIWISIEDDNFWDEIERGERFGMGDLLKVRMEIEQTRDADGLHTEHTVIQVLEHVPNPGGGETPAMFDV